MTTTVAINTLRFLLSVCLSVRLCVTDVGVAVTNLQVVCKIITCVSAFTEMAILIFLEIARDKKLLQAWTLCVAGYTKGAIVGACHCTSYGQEHKFIWRAGPERDMIFHLRVEACREQGSHCCDERLAWVASRWQGTFAPAHSSRKSWERTTRELTTFILWLIKFAMCTDRK